MNLVVSGNICSNFISLYAIPIQTAIVVFPILALIFTFPFAYQEYHKSGSIHLIKAGVLYSFIFYLLCVYFLVILPLPSRASTEGELWYRHIQLIPFNSITPFFIKNGVSIQSIKLFLTSFYFYQFAYNIIMVVPFGIYLRYFFKKDLKKVLLYSFALSFFLEFSQVSALYGIYPGPYRCGDIDDLFCNTLGGCIGYLIAPALTFFMPNREKLDLVDLEEAKRITPIRLIIVLLTDLTIVFTPIVLMGYLGKLMNYQFPTIFTLLDFYIVLFLIYLILCNIGDGDSPGTTLCNMKMVDDQNGIPSNKQLCIRYFILAMELVILHYFHSLLALGLVIYILFHKKTMLYEKLSHTHFVSCI